MFRAPQRWALLQNRCESLHRAQAAQAQTYKRAAGWVVLAHGIMDENLMDHGRVPGEINKTRRSESKISSAPRHSDVESKRSLFLTSHAALSVLRPRPPPEPPRRLLSALRCSALLALPLHLCPHLILLSSPSLSASFLPPLRTVQTPSHFVARPARDSLSIQASALSSFCAPSLRFSSSSRPPPSPSHSPSKRPFFASFDPIGHRPLQIGSLQRRSRGMHPRRSSAAPARFRPTSDEHDV